MTYTAQPLVGYKALVNLASGSTSGTNLSLVDSGDHTTFTVSLSSAQRYLDRAVAVTVQTSTDGGSTWSTAGAGTYTLRYLTASVTLNSALTGTPACRLSAFNYYPYSAIVQSYDVTFTDTTAMLDVTNHQGPSGAGFMNVIPGIVKGTFALKEWRLTPGGQVYTGHLVTRDLVILSLSEGNGANFIESYCYVDNSTLMANLTTASEEDMNFSCDGILSFL